MADMTVTVTMAAEEFVEFLEWKKDRAVYSAQLVKMRRLPEVIYKKLEYALEPDPKKAGKFKITDHEHLADLWDMAKGVFRKIKENHLRLVLTTRRGDQVTQRRGRREDPIFQPQLRRPEAHRAEGHRRPRDGRTQEGHPVGRHRGRMGQKGAAA